MLAGTQDTALNETPPATGSGFETDHASPFHDSANVWVTPAVVVLPIARHRLALAHDVLESELEVPGLGLETIDQDVTEADAGSLTKIADDALRPAARSTARDRTPRRGAPIWCLAWCVRLRRSGRGHDS
jgi:hypothetical protein